MIRDGLLRDPERRRGGHSPSLSREQAIAFYESTERLAVLIERYGVSRHVIVSIRGGRNYRRFTKYLKRGIHGCKHLSAKQIRMIRTMPGSNCTIGLALGNASSSVSRYRRPGSTCIPDQLRDAIRSAQGTGREIAKRFGVSQTSVFPIGRTRWRRLPPCFDLAVEGPPLATPRLIDELDTFCTETVRGFPLVEAPISKEQSRSLDRHTQKSSAYSPVAEDCEH